MQVIVLSTVSDCELHYFVVVYIPLFYRSLPVQRFNWVGWSILDQKMSESSANPQASALSRKPSSEFPFFSYHLAGDSTPAQTILVLFDLGQRQILDSTDQLIICDIFTIFRQRLQAAKTARMATYSHCRDSAPHLFRHWNFFYTHWDWAALLF